MFRISCTLADLGAGATRDDLRIVYSSTQTTIDVIKTILALAGLEQLRVEVGYTSGTANDTTSIDSVFCDYTGSNLDYATRLCESFAVIVDNVQKGIVLRAKSKPEVNLVEGSYTPEEFAELLARTVAELRGCR